MQKVVTRDTRVIDAHGAFVTPGFIDSHVHFITGGFALRSVQLRDAATREEFIHRIKAFAATQRPGVWITGGEWDHTLWGGELPRHQWIIPSRRTIPCSSTASTAIWPSQTAPQWRPRMCRLPLVT